MLNNYYNKQLKLFARDNRNSSTRREIRLWCEILKASKTGYQFLRQRPILNYIADFLCKELKLIIEVDGISHDSKTHQDIKRDEDLRAIGFTVLRFSDREIFEELESVESRIAIWIKEHTEYEES